MPYVSVLVWLNRLLVLINPNISSTRSCSLLIGSIDKEHSIIHNANFQPILFSIIHRVRDDCIELIVNFSETSLIIYIYIWISRYIIKSTLWLSFTTISLRLGGSCSSTSKRSSTLKWFIHSGSLTFNSIEWVGLNTYNKLKWRYNNGCCNMIYDLLTIDSQLFGSIVHDILLISISLWIFWNFRRSPAGARYYTLIQYSQEKW
jgi:hypothetical protein